MLLFLLAAEYNWPMPVKRNISMEVLKISGWCADINEPIKEINDAIWDLDLIRHFECATFFAANAIYRSGGGRWFYDEKRFNFTDLKEKFAKNSICDNFVANKTAKTSYDLIYTDNEYSLVYRIYGILHYQYTLKCMYLRAKYSCRSLYEW